MNLKSILSASVMSGILLSLSGVVLGILLAVADYHVDLWPALCLILMTVLIHLQMTSGNKVLLAASVAGAVLTVYLSFGKIFALEPLLLLLFGYFILRLVKGIGDSGRVSESVVTCLVKGPVALFGAYFLCTHTFGFWLLLLPSFSIGMLCMTTEGLSDGYGRNLVAVLTVSALALMTAFSFMRFFHPAHFIYAVMIPVFLAFILRMYMKKEQTLDQYGSVYALCTVVLAVLTGFGFIEYLF